MHVAWTARSDLSTYDTLYGNQAEGLADWDTTADTYRYGTYTEIGGPTLAFDSDGNGFMVWFANDGTNPVDVRVGRYVKDASTPWKSQDEIPAGAGVPNIDYANNNRPEIVTDEDGGAMVLWKTNSGEISSSRFTKAAGWTDAAPADASDGLVTRIRPARGSSRRRIRLGVDQDVEECATSSRIATSAVPGRPRLIS